MLKALASRIEIDFESYDPKARDIVFWPQIEGWDEYGLGQGNMKSIVAVWWISGIWMKLARIDP